MCSPRKYKKTKTKVWQSHVLGGSKMEWWDFGFWSSERAGLTWARQPPCRRKPGLPGTSGSLPIARAYGWQRWEVLPSDSAILAFWDLWLHPQLRPTLSSRKEAGASPTLSAHPAASYSTCILHVTMLVVVPAHRGPGLLWSCNKKHQAQDLGPSPERWVRTESLGADPENNVQWRPTNSPTIVLSVNFPW